MRWITWTHVISRYKQVAYLHESMRLTRFLFLIPFEFLLNTHAFSHIIITNRMLIIADACMIIAMLRLASVFSRLSLPQSTLPNVYFGRRFKGAKEIKPDDSRDLHKQLDEQRSETKNDNTSISRKSKLSMPIVNMKLRRWPNYRLCLLQRPWWEASFSQ